MSLYKNPKHTIAASCGAYIVQAIIVNFAPLLFVTFQTQYAMRLDQLALLVSVSFIVQLMADWITPLFVDKMGYRGPIVAALILASGGLASLAFLPELTPDPATGMMIACVLYALGGGMIEVLISPLVEACPTGIDQGKMSLVHSFYCWGQMLVILLSTAFFVGVGIQNWKILAVIWAVVPLVVAVWFTRVPIWQLPAGTAKTSVKGTLLRPLFWVFLLMMVAAGAAEQAVAQWASAFAEKGLAVSKTVGDLAGPCAFAFLMGTSRLVYARNSHRVSLEKCLWASGFLCLAGYLLIALSPHPAVGLIGCAVCGLAVGIMWPGTYSLLGRRMTGVSTAAFALLALAGDLGCTVGPALVGLVSGAAADNLKIGLSAATLFPVLLLIGLALCRKKTPI